MYTRRNAYPPSVLGEHAGHEIVVDVDRHELPAVATTRCNTCGKELERQQLPIRVIAFGHMCFGDGNGNWHLELMPVTFHVQPHNAPRGDQTSPELRKFIAAEVGSLLAQLEMRTTEATADFHNGTVIREPAMMIEPVTLTEDSSGYEQHAAAAFETLWQAHSNTNEVEQALAAMPLVKKLLKRYHDAYYKVAQDEDQVAKAHSRFLKAVETLYTYFNPIGPDEPDEPAIDPNEWWGENPPKTEAAPS